MDSFTELAAHILATAPRLGPVRLVAVDGPSGAGKSWFAGKLAAAAGMPLVHTDDLLDGWDDQFTFWERLEEQVLAPLRCGRTATYRRYQWDRGEFGGSRVTVGPAAAVLVEGVTSARRTVRPELSFSVFVTAPAELRWRRAVARDGGDDVAFRAYLERWRLAEEEHFAAEGTAGAVDLVVDGAAEVPGDRYVPLQEPLHWPRSAV
ncbi:uridine kinase [Actinoplanes sp. NPDC051859]|uniref:uridine kinase n=1 Tax=Actinoplanes sp. NPDC051859 TaxID=3363909 RepID=UPI0037B8F2AC